MLMFLAFGILLSFSRGAWFNAAVATTIYLYFTFIFSTNNRQRLKIIGLCSAAGLVLTAGLTVALHVDGVGELLSQRASLTQDYDVGPNGRFGGQAKARGMIVVEPLGIGALEFSKWYHHEDVHNVYLSMFLNAGWFGGLIFLSMMLVTAVLGFQHALRARSTRPYFLIAYAAFIGTMLEGYIVDIDHWRHLYLLMAIVWGLMAAHRLPEAKQQLPNLTAPTRRRSRILAPTAA